MRILLSRALILTLFFLFAAGCDALSPPVEVQVVQRCPGINMDALTGTFGRVEGGNNINSRFRFRFYQEGEKTRAKFVAGKDARFLMDGVRTGNESMTLTQVVPEPKANERTRRVWLSLNESCRLEAADGWVRFEAGGEREGKEPGEPMVFVPFNLDRLDFEPCTERLYLRKAARDRATAQRTSLPDKPPVVTESSLPIGTWAPRSELAAGCRGEVDLWVDGEAEAEALAIPAGKGTDIHWYVDFDVRTLGNHGLAMHRIETCGEERKLLGVACANIEVR
ncbi:MAG TPA: hypothetical protein DIU15_19185 [Deltaproteobacteria bacterium]|nr:hypothetical protein [Deltaproteobacteria bacterium]HCP48171.1 hypothetical protein [Deltaproteobacteria bacterium]